MKLNLTPIIDIVFLLIIFLIIVYQRIDAQNFPVDVPQNCSSSQQEQTQDSPATVSLFFSPDDKKITYAIGAKKCPYTKTKKIVEWLRKSINSEIAEKNSKNIRLRIDKKIEYKKTQLILTAAAQSNAAGLEIATIQNAKTPQ